MDKLISITKNHYPIIIVAILLFIGVFKLPYGYYTFLRLVVFISSLYLGYKYYKGKIELWAWIFLLIGITFNPIIPIYLSKTMWVYIDLLVGCVFLIPIRHFKTTYNIHNNKKNLPPDRDSPF
jgi:hypothetical protein